MPRSVTADEARSWVIRKGLAQGDQVILDNFIKLSPGAPVQIAAPEQAAQPQS